ncbi:guanylate cyclase soluble subunit beta-2-like isoform X1 [Tachysurus vachellii]|uniref:guanylate cyclase soluble subunit beta-2-like isoform X1 n=1 Tax=Tachysurus vachellii TaxID=175792 RepID=UPI00296B1B3F|nr:guanylate cyclase soluble subunit beta-2-like isoform X1 [Tachysurus vachellii]
MRCTEMTSPCDWWQRHAHFLEMNAPSFRVEKNCDGSMFLHYYSDRSGLCHIVPGIIGAVAKDFFNSQIDMKIVNKTEELERTGKKEHVVFLVSNSPVISEQLRSKSASTSKLGRTSGRRNNMQDIERSRLQENKQLKYGTHRNHWETIRSIVQLGKGKLLRGFEPIYPDELCIDLKTFCNAFPFHIVFDEQLRVRQAGVTVQKIVPGLQTTGIRLDQYFTILHPEVTFTIGSIRKFINSHFVLQTRRDAMPEYWKEMPMLELRGQMLWMAPLHCMLYQASPLLRNLQELEERHMYLSDIAPHDATRHLILLNQQRLAEIELSSQLERKKEQLRQLSQHLEQEKQKTENLLYAMLPKHVANQLKEGKRVEAGEFKECTILFSDVVTFTNICSQCEPIQIVNMLNSMYLKFDRLTTVHNVYKVETIGDAYMVVGGVPIPVSSHAERVANFALGMIIAAKEVTNPITGGPIQIRVGLHSGPVLAGVVGEKMPRYCLFGDTVNTASRMESHGLPNKIHISPKVYHALQDKEFKLEERGEIEVKGKGRMQTYFLLKNLRATENEIIGRQMREAGSGQESVQSGADGGTELPAFRQSPAFQNKERHHTVAMRYSDSLDDNKPPSLFPETLTSTKCLTGSSNYRRLHSGSRCEDEPFEANEVAVRRGPEGAEPPPKPAPNKRHVYSRFCVVT